MAEYWLETETPRVIAIAQAESMAPFGAIRMEWGDMFEVEVFPAVTVEEGMEMLEQEVGSQR